MNTNNGEEIKNQNEHVSFNSNINGNFVEAYGRFEKNDNYEQQRNYIRETLNQNRNSNLEENKMNMEKYLPIGTVVLLKNAKKRVMITGFAVTGKESGNKIFDYIGCLYPEGVISSETNLLFDHAQIDKIFYMGYVDNEWKELEPNLKKAVDEMNNSANKAI